MIVNRLGRDTHYKDAPGPFEIILIYIAKKGCGPNRTTSFFAILQVKSPPLSGSPAQSGYTQASADASHRTETASSSATHRTGKSYSQEHGFIPLCLQLKQFR
jgi:hypothetical protein